MVSLCLCVAEGALDRGHPSSVAYPEAHAPCLLDCSRIAALTYRWAYCFDSTVWALAPSVMPLGRATTLSPPCLSAASFAAPASLPGAHTDSPVLEPTPISQCRLSALAPGVTGPVSLHSLVRLSPPRRARATGAPRPAGTGGYMCSQTAGPRTGRAAQARRALKPQEFRARHIYDTRHPRAQKSDPPVHRDDVSRVEHT